MSQSIPSQRSTEKLLTLGAAAEALGLRYFKLQRGAKAGLFPVYRLLNGRTLVRLSEVMAVIERTRTGGEK